MSDFQIKILIVFLSFNVLLLSTPALSQTETNVFRYHIPSEPQSLDPTMLKGSDASYFFNNIMHGLYVYSNEKGLVAEGAESCEFVNPLRLECRLAKDAFWSDGVLVAADDYVRSFKKLLSSTSKNPSLELLQNVKNAMAFNRGGSDALGIRAEAKDRLIFEFEKPDPDFLYKLTASVLAPIRSETYPKKPEIKGILFNGPYIVTSWTAGRRLRLEKNPHYKRGNPSRPPVEVLFIDDDQTALNLYTEKTLTFLRRLPTSLIAKYKGRPDFMQIPVARFDYVGFGEALRNYPDFRAALSMAADYSEMQKMLDALGLPGCPSLPEEYMDHSRCVSFNLKKAKAHWAKVPKKIREARYTFAFSKLGGDDISRAAEWFQAQWKKNLGLTVDLQSTEQGVYLQTLRTKTPPIFRKGVGLDRPTCLAALETFAPGGSENFLKLESSKFTGLIQRLAEAPQGSKASREACGNGVQYLLDHSLVIPLGRIHFTLLADTKFKGWALNEMNQLDLSKLEFLGPK